MYGSVQWHAGQCATDSDGCDIRVGALVGSRADSSTLPGLIVFSYSGQCNIEDAA